MPKKTITVDDLDLIFIRAQGPDGRWGNVNLRDVTEQQFDEWARTRATITTNPDHEWDAQERAAFCDVLWQQDALVMLRREAPTTAPTVIAQMTLEEIADDLEVLREANYETLSIADYSLFDVYIHAVRAKAPGHDPATCDACAYYGFNRTPPEEAATNVK